MWSFVILLCAETYLDPLAAVVYRFYACASLVDSGIRILRSEFDAQSTRCRHSREGALALADCECFGRIVPSQLVSGVLPLLVIVGFVIVLVDGELGICAGIDANLIRRVELLGGVLNNRNHRHNTSPAHTDRHTGE